MCSRVEGTEDVAVGLPAVVFHVNFRFFLWARAVPPTGGGAVSEARGSPVKMNMSTVGA